MRVGRQTDRQTDRYYDTNYFLRNFANSSNEVYKNSFDKMILRPQSNYNDPWIKHFLSNSLIDIISSLFAYIFEHFQLFFFSLCFTDRASQYNLRNWPTQCKNSCFVISLLYSSTRFEHCCAHHQEVKLYYTASGIVTLKQVSCFSVTIPDALLYNLTSWWWAQQCSKRVEEYNKFIIKQEFVHWVGQLLRLLSITYVVNVYKFD